MAVELLLVWSSAFVCHGSGTVAFVSKVKMRPVWGWSDGLHEQLAEV